MVYYKLIKTIIDVLGFAKIIMSVIVQHYDLPNLIINNKSLLFTSKFWSMFYYFLASRNAYLPPSIYKLAVKPNSKIIL